MKGRSGAGLVRGEGGRHDPETGFVVMAGVARAGAAFGRRNLALAAGENDGQFLDGCSAAGTSAP